MFTGSERALLDQALEVPDDAVAKVLADALVERGAALGDFLQAAMATDLSLARGLLPSTLAALRDDGLRWADALSFFRGLPVAAMAQAERMVRFADASSAQWPLDELHVEGSQVGAFHAVLQLPLLQRVRRVALVGRVSSGYTMFVDGPPPPMPPLPALRWLRPFEGAVPGHWRAVLLPAFAHVETLNLRAAVDLDTWANALPRLRILELESARPPPPELAAAVERWARLRELEVRFNGAPISGLGPQLDALGLVTRQSDLPVPTDELPLHAGEEPPHDAARFLTLDAAGTTLRLSVPALSDSWFRVHWRRNLHAQLRQLPPLAGVLRPLAISAGQAVTEVTVAAPVTPLHTTPAQSEARARWLHGRLLALLEAGTAIDVLTQDMLFSREGEPVLFPVKDPQLSTGLAWRGEERMLGLPLPPERVGSPAGVRQLVASVEHEWKTGRALRPLSADALSLRRAWRAFLGG